jgi:glutamine synthetase
LENLADFFREYRIDEIECTIPDMHGISRGKAMPPTKFAQSTATFLPFSIFFQTITGAYIEYESKDYDTEKDLCLIPDMSTIRPIPWAVSPSLHVIHDLHYLDGQPVTCAPRNVLKHIIGLYQAKGWNPVVAPEIEFYLTKRNINPDHPLEPPVGRSGRQSVGNQAYSMMAIDEYSPVIDAIYEYAESQSLDIETIIQEGGPAQFEINLNHGDALELADSVFLFKRLIREAALRHDCYATFMAKPMSNQPGSAMHIHQSIDDITTGKNIFNDTNDQPTPEFYNFIGGHQKYLSSVMCMLAPYVNSYRRYVASGSAPINLEWGHDNRSAGLRVPNSAPKARRVENRIAGVDTNPYLAIAASLATGYLGMVNKIEPSAAFKGEAYEADYGFPRELRLAVAEFDDCEEIREIFGKQFSGIYSALKEQEYDESMNVVTPWEREHLLLTV